MKNHSFVLAFLILSFVFLSNCSSTKVSNLKMPKNTVQSDFSQIKRSTAQSYNDPLIRMDFKTDELKAACEANINELNLNLDTEVHNVFDLDRVLTNFKDTMLSLTFMAYVHKDKIVRGEGSACEENSNKALVSLFAKRKLFEIVNATVTQTDGEERLKSEFKREFLKNGMNLNDADLSQFIKLKSELVKLESEFTKNLNEDTSFVLFSKSELAGASNDFINRLKKVSVVEHGKKLIKYKVTTKSTDYIEVLENVKVSKTREILNAKYENRVAKENTGLLEKAVDLRHEIAKLLKYKNWADYKIEGRMAKDSDHVMSLLNDLRVRLRPRLEKDLHVLLQAKQKLEDPKATSLNPWDIRYFENQLKKSVYSVDTEVIREYFPKDQVMKGLFEVYSTLLHVHYDEVVSAKVWATGVKLYAIRENSSNDIIGYFYADFIPREGKYSHAAAFTLLNGRVLESGLYSQPVSAIVANFSPPTKDKPSLLTHDEVETLFHEFGHIMHQTITKAPYGSLSGSNTTQDFVEAPSQMLENWVWDSEILNKISGHYLDVNKKLPKQIIEKMLAAKDFNQGYFYSRQLLLGLVDMTMHLSNTHVDITKLFKDMYKDVLAFAPGADTHFMAGFGHMMGEYDAGYYGYLWSDVYAADMFTEFKRTGLLNSDTGMKYRKSILELGNMVEASELVENFLGRKSNSDAFYKKLGL